MLTYFESAAVSGSAEYIPFFKKRMNFMYMDVLLEGVSWDWSCHVGAGN